MKKLAPVTPGELLREEFLKPLGISQYRLAKEIEVPAQRMSEIVRRKRAITADTDLRLSRFFGLSKGYWLRAQAAYDMEVAEAELASALKKIKPWRNCQKPSTEKRFSRRPGDRNRYFAETIITVHGMDCWYPPEAGNIDPNHC